MIKINIKNLTNLVETFETINKETKGNDFYGYYIEYKKPTTLLMTEFYFAFTDIYELYAIESFNECSEHQIWNEVLAKYIGFTSVEHMIRWFDAHPKIWTKKITFHYFVLSMEGCDRTEHEKTKAQRVTEQWREILDLLIKEKK